LLRSRPIVSSSARQAVDAFKMTRPQAIVMRDIYAGALLYPDAVSWLGQDYADYLQQYDYTVVMAYPFMDNEEEPYEYLQRVAKVIKDKNGVAKTIVKIQSYDWQKNRWLPAGVFSKQMSTLKRAGMKNLGYYPNTFCFWPK